MKNMKVTFSDTTLDFAGWTIEKCGQALMDLCLVIRDHPQIVDNDFFQDALDNVLKLFALCHGNLNGIRCNLVYEMLLQFNVEGYYFLEDLIHNTTVGSIMRRIMQSERDEKVLELIEANDKLNRTEIARLLAKSDSTNTWISQVFDDIELVHNGVKTWDWFYQKHCNDRNTFELQFSDDLIHQIYEYFHSDAYRDADNVIVEIS